MSNDVNKPEEFQDPLENYDAKSYSDPLEQSLMEEEVSVIRHEPFVAITPDTPVHEAVEKLAGLHIACLLVADDGELKGVFSERDVLCKVALEFEKVKDSPVSEVMTSEAIFVYDSDPAVTALAVMAQCGYRHVPVLDVDEKLVGIISPQRVTTFLQNQV